MSAEERGQTTESTHVVASERLDTGWKHVVQEQQCMCATWKAGLNVRIGGGRRGLATTLSDRGLARVTDPSGRH